MQTPLGWTRRRAKSNGYRARPNPQASSTSTRFWATSMLVIRKERTSPARSDFGLAARLGPDFHFCASKAESEEISALDALAEASAAFGSASLHTAITPSPSSTLARVAETSTTRPLT